MKKSQDFRLVDMRSQHLETGLEGGGWRKRYLGETLPPGATLQRGFALPTPGRKGISGITLNPGLLAVQPMGYHHCVRRPRQLSQG